MTGPTYSADFYADLLGRAVPSARRILPIVAEYVRVDRVVDIGCGTGDWLATAAALGSSRVVGLDGAYVPVDRLAISKEQFVPTDLETQISLQAPVDLALCLEVAEHLSSGRAAGLVHDLCRLAPAVLFSAAIPGQGGVGHINEQWQSYWVALFAEHGFECWDVVRPRVWHADDTAWCYRQNAFLFVDPQRLGSRLALAPIISDLVHPLAYREAIQPPETPGLGSVLKSLPRAAKRTLDHRRKHG